MFTVLQEIIYAATARIYLSTLPTPEIMRFVFVSTWDFLVGIASSVGWNDLFYPSIILAKTARAFFTPECPTQHGQPEHFSVNQAICGPKTKSLELLPSWQERQRDRKEMQSLPDRVWPVHRSERVP